MGSDEGRQITAEHRLDAAHGGAASVVDNDVLGHVVGAAFLRAVGHPDLVAPDGLAITYLPSPLRLSDPRHQDNHGALSVDRLTALVLAGCDNTGWEMGDTDGAVGRVDALAALPLGPKHVDTQIPLVNPDGGGVRNRQDGDAGRRGVDTSAFLGNGHPLNPMDPGLADQCRCTGAAHHDGRVADTPAAPGRIDDIKRPALASGKLPIHRQEFGGPQRRFLTTYPGADLDNDGLGVARRCPSGLRTHASSRAIERPAIAGP